jgi:hypothetical protein
VRSGPCEVGWTARLPPMPSEVVLVEQIGAAVLAERENERLVSNRKGEWCGSTQGAEVRLFSD